MQRLLRNLPRALACALLLAAAPLQAAIRVDIDGVDAELKRNVEAFLSVERYKDRDKMEEDTVVRLYNRIDEEVRSALKPLGYYEPQMHSTYESSKNDKDWRIRITIEPGKPVIIESAEVGIEGPGKDDPVFRQVRDRDTLRKGVRLNHGNYEQAKGDLQRIAAAYGYLDAKLLENQMKVDPAAHRADIRLRLDTGPRYHFGEIRIEQSVIRPELMRRFMRFKEGDPFSAALLLRTQFALDDSQYFSTLEVLPQDRDPATLSVPVSITAKQNRQSFSLGGGYGTDTGLRGTFGWTDPRINDLGHRFRVEVQASNITRRIDARYDVPMGDPAVERMSLLATDRKDQTADLETTELSLTPSVTQVQGGWQRVFSLAWSTPRPTTARRCSRRTCWCRASATPPYPRAIWGRHSSAAPSRPILSAQSMHWARMRTSCACTCRVSGYLTCSPSGICCCAGSWAPASPATSTACPASTASSPAATAACVALPTTPSPRWRASCCAGRPRPRSAI